MCLNLTVSEVEESTSLVHELRVGPPLDHLAISNKRDRVEVLDRVDPVSHHDRGPPDHDPARICQSQVTTNDTFLRQYSYKISLSLLSLIEAEPFSM